MNRVLSDTKLRQQFQTSFTVFECHETKNKHLVEMAKFGQMPVMRAATKIKCRIDFTEIRTQAPERNRFLVCRIRPLCHEVPFPRSLRFRTIVFKLRASPLRTHFLIPMSIFWKSDHQRDILRLEIPKFWTCFVLEEFGQHCFSTAVKK
jgi:hypothetical protein